MCVCICLSASVSLQVEAAKLRDSRLLQRVLWTCSDKYAIHIVSCSSRQELDRQLSVVAAIRLQDASTATKGAVRLNRQPGNTSSLPASNIPLLRRVASEVSCREFSVSALTQVRY